MGVAPPPWSRSCLRSSAECSEVMEGGFGRPLSNRSARGPTGHRLAANDGAMRFK